MSQSVHIGDAELFNWFMPPFVEAVRGGVSHIMTCYNIVDGIPGCLRGDLVNGFLRGRLGWNGVIFSDAGAFSAAEDADVVVLVLGGSSVPNRAIGYTDGGTAIVAADVKGDDELEKDSGEGFDRSSLDLGGVQLELLRELKRMGKTVVTVLVMGRPMALAEVARLSDAVLLAWYPGSEGGTAVAETLFGEVNPGGRLPISFPRNVGQLPVFYNKIRPHEDYVDGPGTPLYPFGYGLSYTKFEVSEPTIAGNVVSVDVKNVGERMGDDVVQMYVHDDVVTTARPFWSLRGFRRVTLAPGESRRVSFPLTGKELGYYNRMLEYVVEPGTFRVFVTDATAPVGVEAAKPENLPCVVYRECAK